VVGSVVGSTVADVAGGVVGSPTVADVAGGIVGAATLAGESGVAGASDHGECEQGGSNKLLGPHCLGSSS